MQQRSAQKLKLECDFDDLELALSKPESEQLFYSASVQFLRKHLEHRSQYQPQTVSTQSCCSLIKPVQILKGREKLCHKNSIEPSSLSMRQVLPFPKSYKVNFFTRLRNTFRKFQLGASRLNSKDDTEISNISNFKFSRCEQCDALHSSCLKNTCKENSGKDYENPCSSYSK